MTSMVAAVNSMVLAVAIVAAFFLLLPWLVRCLFGCARLFALYDWYWDRVLGSQKRG